jgi:hypothetical protein
VQEDIYWTNKDIRDYVGCGVNKASQIRKEAILHHDGFIPLLPRKVKKQAVLDALENIKRKKRN